MKHLKLFFALFAMLALNVGNAWGAETVETISYSNHKGKGTSSTGSAYTMNGDKFSITDSKFYCDATKTYAQFYANSTITITPNTGVTIKNIVITASSSSYNGFQSSGTFTPSIGSVTKTDGTHITWAGSATSEFTISHNKQIRWTAIEVTYEETTSGGGENPGEGGGGEDPDSGEETSATMTAGTNGTACTVNEKDGIKVGTSKKGGDMQITVPAGATMLHVYAAAWKGVTGLSLNITPTSNVTTTSIALTADAGIANSTPFTLSGNEADYLFDIPLQNITTETTLTFTSSTAKRFVVWGATCETAGSDEPGSGETVASLTPDPASLDFGKITENTTATAKEFTISGSNLTSGDLTITAPEGYSVTPTTVAVSGATLESASIKVTPVTSKVGTFDGNLTITGCGLKSAVNVALKLTVEKAPANPTDNVYVKVTTTAGITDGEYLIVYEDATNTIPAPLAFNGALETLDAAKNTVAVEISNSTIAGNTDIDAALFTIDVTAGTLKSASGKYIGVSSNTNGLKTEDVANDYKHAFSVDENGNAVIAADFEGSTMSLRYNNTAGDNNLRFRYYKNAGQQPIALYKKASSQTVTIATCENGSVSASVANGAKVLSGTTITLSNTPTTGYKLTAYDVYKTGDNTTKVTVTDGKFIMPEFDVTISATFELAKTLTSIEITSAATQTTFWQGETFNYTGLEVTAHFDGAADEVVTPTVTGSTATAGTQTVSVSFTEGTVTKTATYTITVKAIPNTKETAYSVADAYDIIDKLGTTSGVFISGIISQVDSYNSTYKSITYWISADGTTTKQLQVYSGKGLESADFSDKTDLSVGDQVIVCGNLKKFSETYEFDKNNYLASHTPTTKDPAGLAYATTEYTANVGEAFTTPELTNPHELVVTYSTSDASKATVDVNTGAVTIVAAGEVTITASTTGDATHDAGSASYTITITNPAMAVATLPFTFNSGKVDIENTAGMSQEGLGGDYNATTKLKFDNTGDWVIIHFDSEPGQLSYEIKGNGFSDGKFTVQQSADGSTYTAVVTYTELGDAATKEHELAAESRYVKFIYTTKSSGNVGLGDIKITKFGETPVDPEVPEVPEEPTLSAAVYQKVISAPADWSGEYILVYEQEDVTDCYVWNGKDENNGYIAATRNNDIISGAFATITIAPMTDGYSVRVNGGDKSGMYIGGVSGSNTISYSAEAILNTIEFSEVGIDLTSNTSVMRFNAASNTLRFRYYKSGQSAVQLYKKLVYTREVTSGNFGTICLPYGSSNYSGAEFFEVAGKETGKVTLNSVKTLVAGTPYIFQATDSKISVVYENEAAEEALVDNGLHGTFEKIDDVKTTSANKGYIIALMNDGTCALQLCGENCWLDPYRAYLVIEEIDKTKSPMPGCRRISMDVQGENIETGVEDIFSTDAPIKVIENGQLIIIRDGIKYNIQGQRL